MTATKVSNRTDTAPENTTEAPGASGLADPLAALQLSDSLRDPLCDPLRAAAAGVRGGGGPLPHADSIQAAFGSHDVAGVEAHTGGAAAEACQAMGARAFASGSDVAFIGAPDLHTAAHEAAHVVQQRAGVRLDGGVGRSGDRYEHHADAVADAVTRGESAERLLDTMAPGVGDASDAVQMDGCQSDPYSWEHLLEEDEGDAAPVPEADVEQEGHEGPGVSDALHAGHYLGSRTNAVASLMARGNQAVGAPGPIAVATAPVSIASGVSMLHEAAGETDGLEQADLIANGSTRAISGGATLVAAGGCAAAAPVAVAAGGAGIGYGIGRAGDEMSANTGLLTEEVVHRNAARGAAGETTEVNESATDRLARVAHEARRRDGRLAREAVTPAFGEGAGDVAGTVAGEVSGAATYVEGIPQAAGEAIASIPVRGYQVVRDHWRDHNQRVDMANAEACYHHDNAGGRGDRGDRTDFDDMMDELENGRGLPDACIEGYVPDAAEAEARCEAGRHPGPRRLARPEE